ncbi:hypothetical protein [Bifidobacterium asteroides]|uniref:hypothetical protein n=1 Tax=Bifidobacterium asteroides TaxID=1684 RepID=UPI00215D82B1|nr:hypothetical protein [Bifidobacterium asteroides]
MLPWNQPSNRYPPLDGSGLGRLAWPPSGMVCWSTLPPPAVSKLTVQAAEDRAWAVAASPEVPRVGDAGVGVVWLRGEDVASGDDDGAAGYHPCRGFQTHLHLLFVQGSGRGRAVWVAGAPGQSGCAGQGQEDSQGGGAMPER